MRVAETVRVMLVDDHKLVRAGLELVLSLEPEIDVVASAGSAAEALSLIEHVPTDVVVLDVMMPGMDGVEATAAIKERRPSVEVLMLSSYPEQAPLRAAMENGARGFLLKSVGGDELVEAIVAASQGRSTIDPDLVPLLFSRPDEAVGASDLTDRERQVLTELAKGRTNQQIAERLGIQSGTVRVYVSSVLAKLGAANRTEAAVIALRHRLAGNDPEQ